jgi:chromosome segregation ATPase
MNAAKRELELNRLQKEAAAIDRKLQTMELKTEEARSSYHSARTRYKQARKESKAARKLLKTCREAVREARRMQRRLANQVAKAERRSADAHKEKSGKNGATPRVIRKPKRPILGVSPRNPSTEAPAGHILKAVKVKRDKAKSKGGKHGKPSAT